MGNLRNNSTIPCRHKLFLCLSVSSDTTIVVLLTYILPIVIVALLSHFYLKQKMNKGMIGSMAIIILGLLGFGYYKDK